MLESEFIKTRSELDFFFFFFLSESALNTEKGTGLKFKDAQTLKSVVMWRYNVHSVALIKPELCHSKGSKCCLDTEAGGREPSGRKHDPHVCRKWSCW